MTTRHAFVAALVAFSAVVGAAVASLGPSAHEPYDPPAGADGRTKVPGGPARLRATQALVPARALRPPVLLVRPDASEPSAPLVLEQARYEVTVNGLAARTRATLVFRNDLGRVLDGELVFPLPEGALVSGFALDVAGRLVDGVVVEAQEARVAFETEVRRGVDPGLVEWVSGNNFRTRVFPIPARGRRTIALEYLTDLVVSGVDGRREALYELPLRFTAPLEELKLKVDVVRGAAAPTVRSGLANFAFSRWEDRYVAEATRRNVQPGDDLRVVIPDVAREGVSLETGDRGETFFVVDDFSSTPIGTAGPSAPPRRIGIAWDASLSRAEADRERDLDLIAAHLAQLGTVEAVVVVFRNVPDAPRRFDVTRGDATGLVAYLRGQPCDGATNLAAVHFPEGAAYTLLFSDGLATLGSGASAGPTHPVYVLSGDPRADHARLRAVAQRTGGAYFNLERHTDADVLAGLGRPVFSLVSVEADAAAVADIEPSGAQAVMGGRVRVAGRLLAPEARITLRYGVPGQPASDTRIVTLRRSASSNATGLVERVWAQQRMATLGVDPEANRADLVRLGQRFSIVTPGTSLLVLETLDQYLEHDVTPPATSPELRAAFLERRAAEGNMKAAKRRDHDGRVVAMWEQHVAWWSHEFVYKPGFLVLPEPPRPLEMAMPGRPVAGEVANRPAQGPAAPVSAPSPARDAAPMRAAEAGGIAATGAAPTLNTELANRQAAEPADSSSSRIVIQPWNPDTPYLRSLRAASDADAYRRYLAERGTYGTSPAFYLDCADFFLAHGQRDLAIRVLTSVAELKLEDARLLRVLAHRLEQVEELDLAVELFDRVLRLRPEEPQSHRDLALALDLRAASRKGSAQSLAPASVEDYARALALLGAIVEREWDPRFPEIEVVALVEANRIASVLERAGAPLAWPVDARLRRLLDFDVRIVLGWDTDATDMDLWVVEPSREKCFFSNARTTIGGNLSRDFTGGYGPEEYSIRRAMAGDYEVKANFYGSRSQQITGPTTVQAIVITDYGRPTEKRRAITLRLTSAREIVDVGTVAVGKGR